MSVDELIASLREVSQAGYGSARVIIEEVGDGYFGDLLRVDSLMLGPDPTLTLVGSTS